MPINKLVQGFQSFRERHFEKNRKLFSELVAHGQHPHVAVVACADSRVSPEIILQAEPGQLFVLRNIANLVPQSDKRWRANATIAGLEYAVLGLYVEHILVLGHSHCGGIQVMMSPDHDHEELPEVNSWVATLAPSCGPALVRDPAISDDEYARLVERYAVRCSLQNLNGYPWIAERVAAGKLQLHGWYFDLAKGTLEWFDVKQGRFVAVGE